MQISNPGEAPIWQVAETEAYAGDPAYSTWLDLNLASIVGSQKTMVLLKYNNQVGAASSSALVVRPNGETELSLTEGINKTKVGAANSFGMCLGITDGAGIIEVLHFGNAGGTVSIDVLAFLAVIG